MQIQSMLSRRFLLLESLLLTSCGSSFCSIIPQKPSAVDQLATGLSNLFGNLDLASGDRLGEGTFASVKRVSVPINATSNVTIAVKMFNQWDRPENIRKESQIQNSLSHPNIIRSYGLQSALLNGSNTLFYEPMEYIPFDLPKYLTEQQPHRGELTRLFSQVCEAVAYMHGKGIVHLDLKPENILITADGLPKIIDFGAAEVLRSPLLVQSSACLPQYQIPSTILVHGIGGSEPYMPPEVYAEEKHDGEKVDIWSLGLILVQLLQRDLSGPWQFSAMEDENFEAFVHAYYDDQVSFDDEDEINDLLVDMLAIDPAMRPTAEEVLYRINNVFV